LRRLKLTGVRCNAVQNDVWVGLFVLIGGAALVFLALQSANLLNLNFQSTYRVSRRV
jgi:phospholipid/cholesterol/gamma-HCH transport system substrate-binding protein